MDINTLVADAQAAAYDAADKFFQEKLGGRDQYACGFAWVEIFDHNGKKIRANSKLGKAMIAAGLRKQDYGSKAWQLWNPSRYGCQNVDTLEAGADAAAQVFQAAGFAAYSCSRLD